MNEPTEVIHVAGPVITAGGVQRQRCQWCGALIQEYDLDRIARPLEPGEDPQNPKPWTPASWEVGAQVAMAGVFPAASWVIEAETHPDDPDAFKIPERSCLNLDADVTR